jgi:hypothetical protein
LREGVLSGLQAFWMLVSVQVVSGLGDAILEIVAMWWIYKGTGSLFATGSVIGVGMVGQLLAGLVGGPLADYVDRRLLMMLCECARCAALVCAIVAVKVSVPAPLALAVALFIVNGCAQIFGPARGAAIADLVPVDFLGRANAIGSIVGQVTRVAGLGVAAVVVVLLGESRGVLIDAGTFLVSAAGIALVRLGSSVSGAGGMRGGLRFATGGFEVVWQTPLLRFAVAIGLLANIGSGLVMTLNPGLSKAMGTGVVGFSSLEMAVASGGVLGGVLAGLAAGVDWRALVVGGLLLDAGTLAVIGVAPSLGVRLVAYAVGAAAVTLLNVPLVTFLQTAAPSGVRGRVLSAFGVLMGGVVPGATAVGGLLADVGGLETAYLVAAGLVGVAGGVAGRLLWVERDGQVRTR